MNHIEGLSRIKLAAHNLAMASPQEGSPLHKLLNCPEWELQALRHFASRVSEIATRRIEAIQRQEEKLLTQKEKKE